MAIHDREDGEGATNPLESQTNIMQDEMNAGQSAGQASGTIGFGGGLSLMNSAVGDKQLAHFVEIFREMYQNTNVKVAVVDQSTYPNMAYSNVIVYRAVGGKVYFFTILMESTGAAPYTAAQIVDEVTQMQRGSVVNIFMPSDAIDEQLESAVKDMITKQLNGNVTAFIPVDGIVVPSSEVVDESIRDIGALAYNAILVQTAIESGETKDISIADAKHQIPSGQLTIATRTTQQTVVDMVGNAKRTDFSAVLSVIDRQQRRVVMTPNARTGDIKVTEVTGFIDALPETVTIPVQFGQPQQLTSLHPHIILNNIKPSQPTLGYALISIITGRLMAQPDMWAGVLMPNSRSAENQVGALNVVTNAEQNQNGVGDILDLTSKELTHQDVLKVVTADMFKLDPIYSIDVEIYGPNYYTESSFVAANSPDPEQSAAAIRAINENAAWMTGGLFKDSGSPFIGEGVPMPSGYWFDSNGNKRDIADVDYAFVANRTNGDPEMMRRYLISTLPYSQTNQDPFVERCAILSELIGNVTITGKVIRHTFRTEWIEKLWEAANAAGFHVTYEPAVVLQNTNAFNNIGSYLAGAHLGSKAGFASQRGGGAGGYRMPNINPLTRY